MDIVSEVRGRLLTAGLISNPVTSLQVVDDDAGDEIVEVTVLDDTSDVDVDRVVDCLRTIPYRISRRPVGSAVRFKVQE